MMYNFQKLIILIFFLQLSFPTGCSKKLENTGSFFWIAPSEVIVKIIDYTPPATKIELCRIDRKINKLIYNNNLLVQLIRDAFRHHVTCGSSVDETFDIFLNNQEKFERVLESQNNRGLFYKVLMESGLKEYFWELADKPWLGIERSECEVQGPLVSNIPGFLATVYMVKVQDAVIKKFDEKNLQTYSSGTVNKVINIEINKSPSNSLNDEQMKIFCDTFCKMLKGKLLVGTTDKIRMILDWKNLPSEFATRAGDLAIALYNIYPGNIKILDLANVSEFFGPESSNETLESIKKQFQIAIDNKVEIFINGSFLHARKRFRQKYPNFLPYFNYDEGWLPKIRDGREPLFFTRDDTKYLCQHGFSTAFVYAICCNRQLFCSKNNFLDSCAVVDALGNWTLPSTVYEDYQLWSTEGEVYYFTLIDAIWRCFISSCKYREEAVIGYPGGQNVMSPLAESRSYIYNFADYFASMLQRFGVDINSFRLMRTKKTILEILFEGIADCEQKKRSSGMVKKQLSELNNTYLSYLSLMFSLKRYKVAKIECTKKFTEKLFYLLSEFAAYESKSLNVLPDQQYPDFVQADCDYFTRVMEQTGVGKGHGFSDGKTLLYHCLPIKDSQNLFLLALVRKLIEKNLITIIPDEAEHVLRGLLRNLSGYDTETQERVIDLLVHDQNCSKTLLHSYFQYANKLDYERVKEIMNRDDFCVTYLKPEPVFIPMMIPGGGTTPMFTPLTVKKTSFEYLIYFCAQPERATFAFDVLERIVALYRDKKFDFNIKLSDGDPLLRQLIEQYAKTTSNKDVLQRLSHLASLIAEPSSTL